MARRAQIGVTSFALTLVWAGLFAAAFVTGRFGQHPTPATAVAAIGWCLVAASGLMVTLACFPAFAELVRPVAQLAAVGATLETVAILFAILPARDRVLDMFQEFGFSNFLLLPSMLVLLASGALYFVRWFSGLSSKTRFEPQGAVQSVFLLFRRHHRLLGWLGLALAGAHSVYYLFLPGPTVEQWSGIAATTLLVILGLEGLITDYGTTVRLWTHRILAILFAAAMAIHWQPLLASATAISAALIVGAFLHLKLISGLARAARALETVTR